MMFLYLTNGVYCKCVRDERRLWGVKGVDRRQKNDGEGGGKGSGRSRKEGREGSSIPKQDGKKES